ncbi:hypothetical protein Mal4_20100 [Maioricimonas rarisocia]|uniref:Uncharacterized protein n=1 Tax=Maioricimonas rarisocia TaxID=2528026 RepID=A0A517Z5F0_9PLAN|nr:hypothetical protein [Maioricimonas rarisocia]QDU37694.1 hypothetical protein Mal4_20100 [Maioricimonas rarisocia]
MATQEKRVPPNRTQSPFVHWTWDCRSAVGLFATLLILVCAVGVRSMQAQELKDIPVDHSNPGLYKDHMAIKFQCHFTIEYLSGSDNYFTSREDLNPDVSSIDDLVKEFEQKTNLRVVVDRQDEQHPVLHLIDKELGKKSEVLDRKIDFQYSGRVGDIAAVMEKQRIPGIEPPRSGIGPLEAFNDHVTEVTIDVKQTSIRHILTHCVDLDEYKRTIWSAKTYQAEDGTWKTQIRFYGPRGR